MRHLSLLRYSNIDFVDVVVFIWHPNNWWRVFYLIQGYEFLVYYMFCLVFHTRKKKVCCWVVVTSSAMQFVLEKNDGRIIFYFRKIQVKNMLIQLGLHNILISTRVVIDIDVRCVKRLWQWSKSFYANMKVAI